MAIEIRSHLYRSCLLGVLILAGCQKESVTALETTPPAPPDTAPPSVPASLTATAASSAQIDLSWTAATDNVGVTGYGLERCQGAGCSNFAQIATPSAMSFNDMGLAASTSYSYRVRAADAAGNLSGYSNVATALTPAQSSSDTTPPSVPANLTATAASSAQINLSWTAATDNVGVTRYGLERCQGAGCPNFAPIATPSGTSFNDTGLTASTSYSYRVRATDAAGNLGGYSGVATAVTPTQRVAYVSAFPSPPAPENPISEGGRWYQNDPNFTRVQTQNGFAYGTQDGLGGFNDSVAMMSGFGNNYSVEVTVWKKPTLSATFREITLVLRGSDSATPGSTSLYGINIEAHGSYGEIGTFAHGNIATVANPPVPQTGDKFKVQIIGQTITYFWNGVPQLLSNGQTSITDNGPNALFSGDPGISFYIDNANALNDDFRITDVTITPQ